MTRNQHEVDELGDLSVPEKGVTGCLLEYRCWDTVDVKPLRLALPHTLTLTLSFMFIPSRLQVARHTNHAMPSRFCWNAGRVWKNKIKKELVSGGKRRAGRFLASSLAHRRRSISVAVAGVQTGSIFSSLRCRVLGREGGEEEETREREMAGTGDWR